MIQHSLPTTITLCSSRSISFYLPTTFPFQAHEHSKRNPDSQCLATSKLRLYNDNQAIHIYPQLTWKVVPFLRLPRIEPLWKDCPVIGDVHPCLAQRSPLHRNESKNRLPAIYGLTTPINTVKAVISPRYLGTFLSLLPTVMKWNKLMVFKGLRRPGEFLRAVTRLEVDQSFDKMAEDLMSNDGHRKKLHLEARPAATFYFYEVRQVFNGAEDPHEVSSTETGHAPWVKIEQDVDSKCFVVVIRDTSASKLHRICIESALKSVGIVCFVSAIFTQWRQRCKSFLSVDAAPQRLGTDALVWYSDKLTESDERYGWSCVMLRVSHLQSISVVESGLSETSRLR